MVLISGKYKQAAGIVSKEVVVEHCAFTKSPTSNWLVDVKCRSGGSDWKSLSKANPKAEVQMKTNDISITLPPLREDTEIAVFGKPGEHDLKRMQMYVFGAKPVQGRNWMIYVYICDDTDMAFENLCENEKRKGNKLLTAGAGLFVPNNNKNVSVELNALEPGWQIKGSSIKTVESRDVWNSPENATDFPSLSFEIHHVDKTRQSFFCAITASNETKATAEIMAVFKKEKETGPHKEYKRFHHKPDVKFCGGLGHSWWNGLKPSNEIALMLVFSIILNGLMMKGALAVDMKNVYPKEIVKLPCPLLEHAIQSGDYRELPWKVADLRDISESERELGYCDENLTCTRYSSLGNLKKRITIRNAVLWVQQWIEDDLLTFTCPVQRKQNKEPLVYKVNFYSSVICLTLSPKGAFNSNGALGKMVSIRNIPEMWWYWIKRDGKMQKIAYCNSESYVFDECNSTCQSRLRIDGARLELMAVREEDRGLQLQCRIFPKFQVSRQVYKMKISVQLPKESRVQSQESRVQSPGSRVQSLVQVLDYAAK